MASFALQEEKSCFLFTYFSLRPKLSVFSSSFQQFRHSQFKCIWCKMQTQRSLYRCTFSVYTKVYTSRLMVSAMSQPQKTSSYAFFYFGFGWYIATDGSPRFVLPPLKCKKAVFISFHLRFASRWRWRPWQVKGRKYIIVHKNPFCNSKLGFFFFSSLELLWLLLSSNAENASEKWLLW